MSDSDAPAAHALREVFDHGPPYAFGAEEEVMALDPESYELAPFAPELLSGPPLDEAFKLELPASQLEIALPPCDSVAELIASLRDARRRLAERLAGRALPAAAGAHPFAPAEGPLNDGERYERIAREYGWAARRQLICGLHVHVGLGGAERSLAVYNAMRSHLPELAALGANAPIHEGRDSGMASVRPVIATALPRQGVPPPLESWEQLAAELAWGRAARRLSSLGEWWWELRLHPVLGTLEVRVPDAQTTPADAGALIATIAALASWLGQRWDAGELAPPAPGWRIAENRWSAARHGVHGQLADLHGGALSPTRERLHELLRELEPLGERLGAAAGLARARELAEDAGADRQRAVFAGEGARGLARHLCEEFLA